ncbi:hypothetical protein [Streptomyces bugieae]|uniref:Uncharacterized protein n=1 Tax=Streptomyces bugieae TaxID=3098223 RepID=A0ABU7NX69_9ACTN|nr:hypothetical protein [Streptomyces sp. DSM 41528]
MDFGAIDAELDSFVLGVGEQVLQGADAQAGLVRNGEAPGCAEGPDLADGSGDGGAVDSVQLGHGLVGQSQPQADQVTSSRSVKTSFGLRPAPRARWR